jgi:hypothetical protein
MEEDIKILKAFIHKPVRQEKFNKISNKEIQAVEHLLNRLEQDERIIEEMAKYIREIKPNYQIYCNDDVCDYHKNNGECKHYCIINHFRKKCE